MIALIQRVSEASVSVGEELVGKIGRGVLALVGVQRGDNEASAERLAERLLGYRIFPDGDGRMNLSVSDIQGELLLVPQFTLAADTQKGTRAGFSRAAAPEDGKRLFEYLLTTVRRSGLRIDTGRFGAHMRVALVNDGPVTFWLEAAP